MVKDKNKAIIITVTIAILMMLTVFVVNCFGKEDKWTGLDIPIDKFIHDFNLLAKTSNDEIVQLKNVAFNGEIYEGDILNNNRQEGKVFIDANNDKIDRVTLSMCFSNSKTYSIIVETVTTMVAGDEAERIIDILMESERYRDDDSIYYEYTENGIKYITGGMNDILIVEILRDK